MGHGEPPCPRILVVFPTVDGSRPLSLCLFHTTPPMPFTLSPALRSRIGLLWGGSLGGALRAVLTGPSSHASAGMDTSRHPGVRPLTLTEAKPDKSQAPAHAVA